MNRWLQSLNYHFPEWRIGFVLLTLTILGCIFVPSFGDIENFKTILVHMSPVGIIAVGMTLVIITGGIDLSVGSLVALIAVLLVGPRGDYSTWHMIFLGLVAGLGLGILNGFFISYASLSPFIVTLSSMAISKGFALWYSDTQERAILEPTFALVGGGKCFGIPVPVLAFFLVSVVGHLILNYTVFGRQIIAVGSNAKAAVESGVNARRLLLVVYAITGLMCGMASLIVCSRLNISTPTVGEFYELDAIAAVIIGGTLLTGGRGTVLGTIFGVLIFGFITNILNLTGTSPHMQRIAKGVIILAAVLVQSNVFYSRFREKTCKKSNKATKIPQS